MKIAVTFCILLYLTLSINCKRGISNRILVEAVAESTNNNLVQETQSDVIKAESPKIEAEAPLAEAKTAEIPVEIKETPKTEILENKPADKEQKITEESKKVETTINDINTETKEETKTEEIKETKTEVAPIVIETPKEEIKIDTKKEDSSAPVVTPLTNSITTKIVGGIFSSYLVYICGGFILLLVSSAAGVLALSTYYKNRVSFSL